MCKYYKHTRSKFSFTALKFLRLIYFHVITFHCSQLSLNLRDLFANMNILDGV